MSVQQDRFTFFAVLVAVVVVVLGYLQLGQLYPVAGRGDDSAGGTPGVETEPIQSKEGEAKAPREGDAWP